MSHYTCTKLKLAGDMTSLNDVTNDSTFFNVLKQVPDSMYSKAETSKGAKHTHTHKKKVNPLTGPLSQ